MFKKINSFLQLVGRSMLLAIAAMPTAAILNRLGDKDLLNLPFIKEAAWTIFAVLPILFAISIAGGIAKDKHVAAGLNGFIVYQILIRTLGPLGNTGMNAYYLTPIPRVQNNILIGIIAGIVAGFTYEKFKDKELPSGLSFFGGRRLVLIMGSFAAVATGYILALVFPTIQKGFDGLGMMIGASEFFGPFLNSFFNRMLIPVGLHHIVNSYIHYQLPSAHAIWAAANPGVVGEVPRYFAGDPTAGKFAAGMFAVMMFGLPGAALAMYKTAKLVNRPKVKGLLLGAAVTSFLTGITEPIEFSFLFVSPILYVVHSVLAGIASLICGGIFGSRIVGVGGSGIIDYFLQFNQATKPILVLVTGGIMFALYYFVFSYLIVKLDAKTPGREEERADLVKLSLNERAEKMLDYLGGVENISELDNCITRLRLKLRDNALIDKEGLKSLGAIDTVIMSNGSVQVVIGLEVEKIATEMRTIYVV